MGSPWQKNSPDKPGWYLVRHKDGRWFEPFLLVEKGLRGGGLGLWPKFGPNWWGLPSVFTDVCHSDDKQDRPKGVVRGVGAEVPGYLWMAMPDESTLDFKCSRQRIEGLAEAGPAWVVMRTHYNNDPAHVVQYGMGELAFTRYYDQEDHQRGVGVSSVYGICHKVVYEPHAMLAKDTWTKFAPFVIPEVPPELLSE